MRELLDNADNIPTFNCRYVVINRHFFYECVRFLKFVFLVRGHS